MTAHALHTPTPTHHPDIGHLVDYAAGSLAEPVALLIASHLTFCPLCREEVARIEALGGALFETIEPQVVKAAVKKNVLASLDAQVPGEDAPPGEPVIADDGPLPRALAEKIGGPLDKTKFSRAGAVREFLLGERKGRYRSKLLSIAPGAVIARHTHQGEELSLVLSGGFTDGDKHFVRGDVATAGPETDHSPVADPHGDCLILAVLDAPLKLTSPLGRLLNPFLKY